jgi:PAS domain S-box-containing protein
MTVAGTHDHALVALSVVIAAVASYTALDLAGRIQAARGWSRHAWLVSSAAAMGGGIWSMHFIAMLAFSMPDMEVHYDLGLTVLSLVVPIVVTGIGFHLVGNRSGGIPLLAFSGGLMGLGIVAMHYIGMAAMRMPAALGYQWVWVALSVLIAIGASTVALWLAFKNTGLAQKLMAAAVMGVAVSGMHYTAMQAAVFTANPAAHGTHGVAILGQTSLALSVAATTFLILFFALIASMFDRRFAMLAEREAAALRRSEEQFRSLYRRTPIPLHALDADGLVEEASDAWLSLLGYTREEVLRRPLTAFMTEDSAVQLVQDDWPDLLAAGHLQNAEHHMVTKAGETLDVLLSARVEHDSKGRFLWATGGLIDVTARRRAEDALRQSQKMEAVGQLTGGVAHDFNNLLAAILGNLELLRKRGVDHPKAQRLIDNAIEGAQRGASLTQRMLSFARQQGLKPVTVDLPDLVRGMEDLLQRSLGPQIRIETRFPPGLSRVLADANQLELALLNLAVNGRDAMPGGGALTIAASNQEIAPGEGDGRACGRFVCLSIADTGEGMDEATLARAREPFFTTKGVGKGTGLGLSMVHGFAEQSGGKLVLDSRAGAGTTAEIWLPAAEADLATSEQESAATSFAKQTVAQLPAVLAVDDDALVLMSTAAMLEDLGYRVFEANSGAEALDLLGREPSIELVITDHAMPGMTGTQLAAAIRAKQPSMPILLATGYAELPQGSELSLPMLGKPFGQESLARAIVDLLERTPVETR